MADPDEALSGRESSAASAEASAALIEAIARVLSPLDGRVREFDARAAYAAVVAHLGLVEETKLIPEWIDLGPCNGTCGMVQCNPEHRVRGLNWVNKRRLASRWVEVDHGSE